MTQHDTPSKDGNTNDSKSKCDQENTSSEPINSSFSKPPEAFLPPSNADRSNTPQVSNPDRRLARELADAHIAHQWIRFDTTFTEIIAEDSSSARSIFPFIRSRLIQFRLQGRYDEVVVLQEVYIRTISKILEGREITNHYAWIRSVAMRYIYELSRKHLRNINIEDQLMEILTPTVDIDDEFLTDEMFKIRRAFRELSSEEQLLLSLKAIQDLSWAEIQEIWLAEGYGEVPLATLRKRKERALSHLRTLYHAL